MNKSRKLYQYLQSYIILVNTYTIHSCILDRYNIPILYPYRKVTHTFKLVPTPTYII
jgi:hypothetical protein